MFFDDLHQTGYRAFSKNFLGRTKVYEDMSEKEKENLINSIVEVKEKAKDRMFRNFFSKEQLKHYKF